MIVVKLELWPHGDHKRARSLGTATISNVGGTLATGNYECRLFKAPEYSPTAEARPLHEMFIKPTAKETWRKGRVEDFPRKRLGPWDLLLRALGAMVSDRNPGVAFDVEVRGDEFGPSGAWEQP